METWVLRADVLAFSTEDDTFFLQPVKDVRIGGSDTPSDAFVSFAF